MTNEEAIKILKTELEVRSNGYYDHLQSGGEGDCEEEASLNALQLAIDALKKHTLTKPNWLYDDEPLCPYCQCVLDEYEEVCGECTQLIDWSELTDWSDAE